MMSLSQSYGWGGGGIQELHEKHKYATPILDTVITPQLSEEEFISTVGRSFE